MVSSHNPPEGTIIENQSEVIQVQFTLLTMCVCVFFLMAHMGSECSLDHLESYGRFPEDGT